jgi:hypothetical protein
MTPARDHLLAALQADLIGPYDPDSGLEVLPLPPIRWYLTGFLVPEGDAHETAAASGDEDEGYEAGDSPGSDDAGANEPEAKHRPILPSSFGLSILLPSAPPQAEGQGRDTLEVRLEWGEYVLRSTTAEVEALCRARGMDPRKYINDGKPPKTLWERVAIPPKRVTLDLGKATPGQLVSEAVPDTTGLKIEYRLETISATDAKALRIGNPGQPARALSVFVVNGRAVKADPNKDARGYSAELNGQSVFQLEMSVHASTALLSRPDAHFANSSDFDDQMVDLQFRREVEWVVGHGISAAPIGRDPSKRVDPIDNPAMGAIARWIPRTNVALVKPNDVDGVIVVMRTLAGITTAADVDTMLGALPKRYAAWIDDQAAITLDDAGHRKTQAELVRRAKLALGRIIDGIELLKTDAELRQAFCWANEAMHEVASRRIGKGKPSFVPKWRLFQLAFLLLNLRGISDPDHDDRDAVDLLFFPTGGGKTEAYLGVIATTLLLRRMRGQARPDEGLGVAVVLRYTLRLLTLDQLERASALVCSLELVRRRHPDRLGRHRYSIGLWVGRSGSPNTFADAKKDIQAYKGKTAESKGSPFPLVKCPWCDTLLDGRGMDTLPRGGAEPTRTIVVCANADCEFSGLGRGDAGKKVGELPVLFVDEHIYSELPAFLVSTVDKFALLTHRGQAGKLFGRVHSYSDRHDHPRMFWGGGDGDDHVAIGASAEALQTGLRPPELIVQDELHLISGPLGTMVGLFETLVEELCHYSQSGGSGASGGTNADGKRVGPKILAATATVRRASAQVQALYARTPEQTKLFPPQGVDAWQTFFAERDTSANERMYVGIAAAGRAMKRILLNTYLTLLGAAEHLYREDGRDPASTDPYKTVVGYFNSLRELGGMRRLVDDEVYSRVRKLDERIPHDARGSGARHRWIRTREIGDPVELTSRVRTTDITRDKARLATRFHTYEQAKADKSLGADAPKPVDVLLASNMISVGIDIDRLGLMVLAGQPKTTSEYIQASSRVGRDDKRPGFVVTVYNLHKPRDRSHYEHFTAYHESFYRYVEAQSVTPFSLPALDRSLASVVVGLVRHSGRPQLAAPRGAEKAALVGEAIEGVAGVLFERANAQQQVVGGGLAQYVSQRSKSIVDKWRGIVSPTADSHGSAAAHCYSPYEEKRAKAIALMRTPEADAAADDANRLRPTDPQFPFVAPTSMRDVEPSIAIWVRRRPDREEE